MTCIPALPKYRPTLGLPNDPSSRKRGCSLKSNSALNKGNTKHMSNGNGQTLAGKVALVTGSSRGIGAAIARRLAADGAKVGITYSKGADAAAAVVKEIERAGGKAIALQADATDAPAVKAAVEKTVATFGRLDILVNNAGTAIPKPFEEATLEELDLVVDINFRGVMVASKAALKHIQNGGRIITIGSCLGERTMAPGLAAYSATKAAVKLFTQGLAREVGSRGITVNNVQPGHRHRSESCRRQLGGGANCQHGTETLRTCRRYRFHGGVRCRPGSVLHHRREPDR